MWRRAVTIAASRGSRRSFGTTSLQKRALLALGNKQNEVPASVAASLNGETFQVPPEKPMMRLSENMKAPDASLNGKASPENSSANDLPNKETFAAEKQEAPPQQQQPPKPIPVAGQLHEFAPRIVVAGVGGAGGNAINNMISKELQGTCLSVFLYSIVCSQQMHSHQSHTHKSHLIQASISWLSIQMPNT